MRWSGSGTGHKIRSVKINTNGGGSTDMEPKSGFGYGVAAFVGYVGPSGAGLLAAWLISIGRIVAVLWLGLLLRAVMVLMVRNFLADSSYSAAARCSSSSCATRRPGSRPPLPMALTWFLLLAAPKIALGVARKPKMWRMQRSSPGGLSSFGRSSAWCFLWVVGTIAALVVGGAILVLSMPRAPNPLRQARFFCGKSHSTGGSLGLEQRGGDGPGCSSEAKAPGKASRSTPPRGWNLGESPACGYACPSGSPTRTPSKAAHGLTKTRLALGPDRAPIVALIYAWRIDEKLGHRDHHGPAERRPGRPARRPDAAGRGECRRRGRHAAESRSTPGIR